MARSYGGVGPAPRIFVLFLLVVALVVGGLAWFDYLGLIDVRDTLAPVLRLAGVQAPAKIANAEDPLLLERERLGKQGEDIDMRAEQLDAREKAVRMKEAQVQQELAAIGERQKALVEQQKSFNDLTKQYENRDANLRQVAQNLLNMPPDSAVAQLVDMSDQDVIDIFRLTDQISTQNGQASIVPYWLSKMPADRAAEISRKMIKQPAEMAEATDGGAVGSGP